VGSIVKMGVSAVALSHAVATFNELLKRLPLLLLGCSFAMPAAVAAEASSREAQRGGQAGRATAPETWPIGPAGQGARYRCAAADGLKPSTVKVFSLVFGPVEQRESKSVQWVLLHATKANAEEFRVWLLSAGYPGQTLKEARAQVVRFILQEGSAAPAECRARFTGAAVLPTLGGWQHLLPRPAPRNAAGPTSAVFPEEARYLGHLYRREALEGSAAFTAPASPRIIELLPDVWVGPASNTRQKDETRRYDGSDYEYVRLTRNDYREMAAAGINCVRVDAEQLAWVQDLDVYYWGVGGRAVPYPECLYRSRYLGPALFLDEPAVVTRDHVIRPRLAKEPEFRKALTPQIVFETFQEHFRQASQEGAPQQLLRGLASRPDVELGQMAFAQENVYTWETMVATAAYQLGQDPFVPAAMVFEPPGRVGVRRTVPELNMTYGCQLAVDDPKHLSGLIYGFLRGGARLTDKSWGTSIYGQVDRADAFWLLTQAYDLGATHFFFWDNARLACVPYGECLALARHLRAHLESHPKRDLEQLKRAAEVAILLPPGYNLGHVHLGKGSLWGLGELNLERRNRSGIPYRTVMSHFFTEIERCARLGITYDLAWDLPGLAFSGYREVIHVREDGKVEVHEDSKRTLLSQARTPPRPSGAPPQLAVALSARRGRAPLQVRARATVVQTDAPVFYTFGADTEGVYHNAVVAWELYGPAEEDYRVLTPPRFKPRVRPDGNRYEVVTDFRLDRPGRYRLRAATVDLAGRTAVTWTAIDVTE